MALLFAVAVATGATGVTGSASRGDDSLVKAHESLPCTGPADPINFEVFSAGPAPAGLPLAATLRRCETAAPAGEVPANYVSYVYGECGIPKADDTGCAPPLEVQTWPACQRSLADYSFEGSSPPYKKLPLGDSSEVVDLELEDTRFEVYTKSATVVIFAQGPALAREAIALMRPQEVGKPPATTAAALGGDDPERLAPLAAPSHGAVEGILPCES